MCTGIDSLYSPIASIICLKSTCLLKPRNYQQLHQPVRESVGFIPVLSWLLLPGSRSTVGFIICDFHALISRQHSQTNRRGLHTLFLTSKSRCVQYNQLCRCPTYHTKRVVLIRSLRRRPYRMKPTAVGFISLTTVKRPLQEFIMEGHAMMATPPTSAPLSSYVGTGPQIQSKHEVCCLYLLSHAIISWFSSSVS